MSIYLSRASVNWHKASRRQAAFTLIELLVSIGITVLIAGLMLTMVSNVLTGWNRTSGKLTSGNQARVVLDQLTQDLQGAILRRDSNTWLVATIQQDQTTTNGDTGMNSARWTAVSGGMVKPTAANGSFDVEPTGRRIEDYRFGQAGVWLRFFTTPPDNRSSAVEYASAPRAVAYQLVRMRVGGSDSTQRAYTLFRSEVQPGNDDESTFDVGYNLLMSDSTSPGYNTGSAASAVVAGTIRRPHADRIIANDVLDFGVKLYGRDSSGNEVELFPVPRDANGGAKTSISSGSVPFTYAATGASTVSSVSVTGVGTIFYPAAYVSLFADSGMNAYPVAAEIMVRVLTGEGVRLIAALEAGELAAPNGTTSDEYWWQLAEQHSQIYTRRVEIKSTAL